ncbi:MAG: hypothetical protein mread185_000314 [Mycoplasmataceae bacterium]|nr:MAG: hypothetical protein mread185_000314 [Mycoplasmataceae bacterium]
MTNQLFFTITKENQQISFASQQYKFTIPNWEQKTGTKGKCLWYYYFDRPDRDLKWISWNQNHNETKSWEYLLLDLKGILYSGYINKSKTKDDTYYCELKPLPPKPNFEIIY